METKKDKIAETAATIIMIVVMIAAFFLSIYLTGRYGYDIRNIFNDGDVFLVFGLSFIILSFILYFAMVVLLLLFGVLLAGAIVILEKIE